MTIVNIADVVNPESGKTYRQENSEMQHQFPLRSLVECKETGLRLFVVMHNRDCDMTPLYHLSFKPDPVGEEVDIPGPDEDTATAFLRGWRRGLERGRYTGGWGGDSLTLIRLPQEKEEE